MLTNNFVSVVKNLITHSNPVGGGGNFYNRYIYINKNDNYSRLSLYRLKEGLSC